MTNLKEVKGEIIIGIKEAILRTKEKCPIIGTPLLLGWRLLCTVKFLAWKAVLEMKTRIKYKKDNLEFDKVYWVNPKKIRYCLRPRKINIWHHYSGVLDGDWDLKRKPFEELDVYRAFRQRFQDGKKWEETDFYKRVLKNMSDGIRKWGCKNKEEFDKRLPKIDKLYYKIKEEGFKTKKELFSPNGLVEKIEKPAVILDDISVAIGRDGELLFIEGRHRLSIAKLLKIDKIPVRIIARHKKWMEFRRELIIFAEENNGQLYQPLTHPDLRDIPHQHGEKRFHIIKENLSFDDGTLLDIGAELGYFCCKFEDEGFDCSAIEQNEKRVYFMNKIKKAENRNFEIIPKSVFDYKKNQKLTFDVVLALNVFHHFLDTKDTYLSMIDLLGRIETKVMFFEAYKPENFRHRNRYKEYDPEEFVSFITKNSSLNRANFIGEAEDGRRIYKIFK